MGSVLARSHAARPGRGAIAVLYDDNESARRALETAATLAVEQQAGLNVLLPVAPGKDAAALRQEAALRRNNFV